MKHPGEKLTRKDLDEFLAFNLNEVCQYIDDGQQRAYAVVGTVAAAGEVVQESMLNLYFDNLAIDRKELTQAIALFSGMQLMTVLCDCDQSNMIFCDANAYSSHPLYDYGEELRLHEAPEFVYYRDSTYALRDELKSLGC